MIRTGYGYNMQLKANNSSSKQPHPGSQTYVGLYNINEQRIQ